MPISDHARHTPEKAALAFNPGGEIVTYKELDDNSRRLAQLLRDRGLRRGDHIALLMENHPRYLEVVLAALRSGLYVTPISRFLSTLEAAYIIKDCEARALVVSPMLAAIAADAVATAPLCVTRLIVDRAVGGFDSYEDALRRYPATAIDPSAGDTMLYSSGTTGRPKGIKRPLRAGVFGRGTNEPPLFNSYGFDTNTVYLCPAPLYHAAPLGFVLATVIRGGRVIIMDEFDPLEALALIEKHRVTHSQWVPTMFVRMLKLPLSEREGFDLSSHRCAIHAAAPCPIEVKRQMIAWWGPIIDEYYSATERIGATRIDSADWLKHPGSVGRPIGGGVLHICAEDGQEAPAEESGLIYFEQPDAGFAYHNAPEKTAASRHPAHPTWITVGDIGRVDEGGYLYLTDRKFFMIISGGVNIYPQAVEDAIIMHPAVGDVAVIGVPDPDMGEAVKAVVELRPGIEACNQLAEEIISFTRQRVARYSVPRSVDFVDRLPRSPTGKLFKKALRDTYWPRTPSSTT